MAAAAAAALAMGVTTRPAGQATLRQPRRVKVIAAVMPLVVVIMVLVVVVLEPQVAIATPLLVVPVALVRPHQLRAQV